MLLRKIIFLIFIIASFSYFLFAAKGVIFPPRLEIYSPKDGESISGTRVYFSGKTIPKTSVWIGGSYTQSDDNGFFEGFLTFHPGYNELGAMVKNHFGKETKKITRFVVE